MTHRLAHTLLRIMRASLWLACALALAPCVRAQGLGQATIQVLGLGVDLDTRPDVAGLQYTMTAVKDIPTGVQTVVGGTAATSASAALPTFTVGTLVKAELSGPAFEDPVTVAAPANGLMEFPRIALAGDYQLTNIRLEDAAGRVLLVRDPALPLVTFNVIDQLLVTQVISRPLTQDEIRARGIIIDESSFTVFNFTVGLTLGSEQVKIELPAILPNNPAQFINNNQLELPQFPAQFNTFPEIKIPNFSIAGFSMRRPPEEEEDDGLKLPPIQGVIIIPGNIAFLNQFFSVILQASNTAPDGSGLVFNNARATIALPAGGDEILGSGDDPLRIARTVNGTSNSLPLLNPGGQAFINPATSAQNEFLVEGLREGTHQVRFNLSGDLTVPSLGRTVPMTGVAGGVVQVRNPTFSIALSHPETVREGEAYSLFATVTNTSQAPANLFQLNIQGRSLSGARLAPGESGRRTLNQLLPGQAETFEFNFIAEATGSVGGTVFLADPSIQGSFLLATGVGNGIPLSPDTLVLPTTVKSLPPDFVRAYVRMLGMAWSVATAPAGALPATTARVSRAFVFNRAVKLAQVGLHVQLGEPLDFALQDLALDLLGNDLARIDQLIPVSKASERAQARADLPAFDELLRSTDAGNDLMTLLGHDLDLTSGTLAQGVRNWAGRFASRPARILFGVETDGPSVGLRLSSPSDGETGGLTTSNTTTTLPYSAALPLAQTPSRFAQVVVAANPSAEEYVLEFKLAAAATATFTLQMPDEQGGTRLVRFAPRSLPAGTYGRMQYTVGANNLYQFRMDLDGDGLFEATLAPEALEPVEDRPPAVLVSQQWGKGASPATQFTFSEGDPLGRMAAVLFDEEVDATQAELLTNYGLPGRKTLSAILQPDRRLVFVVFDAPFGPFVPCELAVSGVSDLFGRVMTASAGEPRSDPARGMGGTVEGRVLSPDGRPIAHASIKYIQPLACAKCDISKADFVIHTYEADADGRYRVDFALANDIVADTADVWLNARNAGGTNHFKLEARDPQMGQIGRASTRVQFDGQRLQVNVIIRGSASLSGHIVEENGEPVDGGDPEDEPLKVFATNISTGDVLTTWIDSSGFYSFPRSYVGSTGVELESPALPVGNVVLQVVRPSDRYTAITTVNLPRAGASITQDLVLLPPERFGNVSGRVLEAGGATGAANVLVGVFAPVLNGVSLYDRTYVSSLVATVITDAAGNFSFTNVPTGDLKLVALRQSTFEKTEAQAFLQPSQALNLTLVLPGTGGTVRGLVRDALGRPAPQARVAGGPTLTQADGDGRFEITGLPLGKFTISAGAVDSPATGRVDVQIVRPGDVQEVVITLEPVGAIRGTVFEADGVTRRVNQAVQLWFQDKGVMAEQKTDAEGNFAFVNFPVARYSVRAVAGDYGDGGMALTEIRFPGDARDADITFRGLGNVSGRVIQSNGTPVLSDVVIMRKVWRIIPDTAGPGGDAPNNYYLDFVNALSQNDLIGDQVDAALASSGYNASQPNVFFFLRDEPVLLKSDGRGPNGEVTGRFTFSGPITGGPFTVSAFGPFLAPAEKDGEIPRTTHPAARQVDVGDIVLEPATGQVRGTVFMPDGITTAGAGIKVTIRSIGTSGDQIQGLAGQPVLPEYSVETDERGQYHFPLVLRGGCTLTADTGVPDPALRAQAAEQIRTDVFATSTGTRLLNVRLFGTSNGSVPRGGVLQANLRLEDAAGVRVTVFENDGLTTLPFARITLATASTLDGEQEAQFIDQIADERGQYTFFPVAEGAFSVVARKSGSPAVGQASGTVPRDPPNGAVIASRVVLGAYTAPGAPPVASTFFGTVRGVVFKADGTTCTNPAQVRVLAGGISLLTTTGVDGRFEVAFVPGGLFRVEAFEPATARRGSVTGALTFQDQVVSANVTLVGLGTVNGTVLLRDGTTVVPFADLRLATSGEFSGDLITRADAQGRFTLPGVPAGNYRITARDAIRGLSGEFISSLNQDGEIQNIELLLDPSARIEGVVYGPGVRIGPENQPLTQAGEPFPNAPVAAGATVQIQSLNSAFQQTVQTDGLGRFASGDNLPLGTYRITVRPAQGDDGAGAEATLEFNGQTVSLALAMEGAGTIAGIVLDSLGQHPAGQVRLTLTSRSKFSSGPVTRITGADGRFQFDAIPIGEFFLAGETITQIPKLGVSASAILTSHGTTLAFEDNDSDPQHNALRLQPSGSISARVRLADGITTASSCVVQVASGSIRFSIVTDARGVFTFAGLPLGTYALSLRDLDTNAVALRSVTLADNGQSTDLGILILDGTRPVVIGSTPAQNAANVDSGSIITLTFNEPIAPATVTDESVELLVNGATTLAEITVSTTSPEVRVRPLTRLPDGQAVKVLVHSDVIGFEGEVLVPGVRDLNGLSLADDFVLAFTTGDFTPPALLSVSPSNGATNVNPNSVVRFEFSEPIDPVSIQSLTLLANNDPVSGTTSVILGNRVVVFTPAVTLLPNRVYTSTLAGPLRDLAGNSATVPNFITQFTTLDTVAPLVTSLDLAPGQVPIQGGAVTAVASVADPDIAFVEFYFNGTLVHTDSASPYGFRFDLSNVANGPAVLGAIAVDLSGNRGALRQLPITIQPNQPPVIQVVKPLSGSVLPGQSIPIVIQASDDLGLTQLSYTANSGAAGSGAVTLNPAQSNAATTFTLVVPNLAEGSAIQIRAFASDLLNVTAPSNIVTLTLNDQTPPQLAFTAPVNNATFIPGQLLAVTLAASDASGIASLRLRTTGAASFDDTKTYQPATSPRVESFNISLPGNVASGAQLQLTATAIDNAGNSVDALLTLTAREQTPPTAQLNLTGATAREPGQLVRFNVTASDNQAVARITAKAGSFQAIRNLAPPRTPVNEAFAFNVSTTTLPGTQLPVVATAIDTSDNVTTASSQLLSIIAVAPPAVQITSPASGSTFAPNSMLSLALAATDSGALRQIDYRTSGALTTSGTLFIAGLTTQSQPTLSFAIPAAAAPGPLSVSVIAHDYAGLASAPATATFTIVDNVKPTVAITAPAPGATIDPRQPLAIQLSAADNTGVTRIELTGSGAAGFSRTLDFIPARTTTTEQLTVSLTPPSTAGTLTLNALARDAAGNSTGAAPVSVNIIDVVAPTLVSSTPADQQSLVESTTQISLTFSEPLDPVSVSEASIRLLAGNPVVISMALSANNTVVTLTPATPLLANTLHQVQLTSGLRDAVGNTLAPTVIQFTTRPADQTGPIVTATSPANNSTGIGISTPVTITFNEAIDPGSVNAASLRVLVNSQATTGTFELLANNAVVRFAPFSPFPLSTLITVELTAAIRDSAGNALTQPNGQPLSQPFSFSFTTGQFGIARPRNGEAVVELQNLLIEAQSSPGLNVNNVLFTINGVDQPAVTAPFRVNFPVPAAASVPQLVIQARARAADNSLITSASVTVPVVTGLRIAPPILGVPIGGQAQAVVYLTAPLATDLLLNLSTRDPAPASFPATRVLPAGTTSLPFSISGLTTGATTLRITSLRGSAEMIVAVSTRVPGRTYEALALIPTASISAPPSLGSYALPANQQVQLTLPLDLAASNQPRVVSIESTRLDVAQPVGTSLLSANSTRLPLTIQTGLAGEAVWTLRLGSLVYRLTLLVDQPNAAREVHAAAPVGFNLLPPRAAGFIIVPVNALTTVQVPFLDQPATQALGITVTSDNPSVARVDASTQVAAGQQLVTLSVLSGSPGEARLTLANGQLVRELRVIVGTPTVGTVPLLIAPPVGALALPPRSAGFVIVAAGSINAISVPFLDQPAGQSLPVIVTSDNPTIARVDSPAQVTAGQQTVDLQLIGDQSGEANVLLTSGQFVRELRVIVGLPASGLVPPILPPPVGVNVLPPRSAGFVIVPANATTSVRLPFLDQPAVAPLPITISSSASSIARVDAPAQVNTGQQTLNVQIISGASGEAQLTLANGQLVRELRVIVGTPAPGSVPSLIAAPVATTLRPNPSLGMVNLPLNASRTLSLSLRSAPGGTLNIPVSASPDGLVTLPGSITLASGALTASLPVTTGANAGETIVKFNVAGIVYELRMVVGPIATDLLTALFAPPVGISNVAVEQGPNGQLRFTNRSEFNLRNANTDWQLFE